MPQFPRPLPPVRALIAFAALALMALSGPAAWAEGRVAVVVGNAEYSGAPLDNPANDARLIAQTLTELGFDTSLYLDVTAAQMPLLLDRISDSMAQADVGLFYFAGHGLQYRGENLLLPTDTNLTSVKGIATAGLPMSQVLDRITAGGKGIRIVVLDACRTVLAGTGEDDLKSGFSFVEAPSGEVLIAFSTGAGEVAQDSDATGSGNSPYSLALANALQQTGADLYDVFRTVRRSVRSSSGGTQIPWITGSIETKLILRPDLAMPQGGPAPATGPALVTTVSGEVLTLDRVLWEYLQSSSDPADFRRFVEVFPDSPFVEAAKGRAALELASGTAAQDSITRDGIMLTPGAIVTEIAPSLPGSETEGRSSPLLDQSGEYVMRDSFRTWPLAYPQTAAGLGSQANACDEEAADPLDASKLTPGVSLARMNLRRALRACAFALADAPDSPRLLFQFGRVLDQARRYDWANAYYDAAIAGGYAAAMVNRGYNARMGRGQDRDFALAFALYMRAAGMGNLRARTNVGTAYRLGEGVDKNPEEGVLWYRLAASMGWPHATTALGDAYRNGTGVEKDPVEAAALYRAAAGQGQTTAMANLGRAYLEGEGVEQDVRTGLDWLERARALGNGYAPLYGGRFYLKGGGGIAADPQKALELFQDSTRRGLAQAYLDLAWGWRDGRFGTGPDLEEAFRNALFAAEGRVKGAEDLAKELAAQLPPGREAALRAEVKTFIDQNGI
jgi:TPR repeat protein